MEVNVVVVLDLDINISQRRFKELARDRSNIPQLMEVLEPEMQAFDRYLENNKADPMGKIEKQIVREFLGHLLARDYRE